MARAMEVAVQHARQLDVVDVIAAALGEAHVLDALALAAHALQFFGAFERSGDGGRRSFRGFLEFEAGHLGGGVLDGLTMF